MKLLKMGIILAHLDQLLELYIFYTHILDRIH